MKRPARLVPATARAVRGLTLGGATAAIGISAHVVGGGHLPEAVPTIAVAGAAACAGAVSTARRGPLSTIVALAFGQLLLHVGLILPSGLLFGDPQDAPPGTSTGLMFGGHLVAVLLAGLALARADSAVFAVYDVVVTSLRRVFRTPPMRVQAPLWVAVTTSRPADSATETLLRRARARRGPPARV